MTVHELFSHQFLITLQSLVGVHHSIYPAIPPQGIYFEGLVEQSFRKIRVPFTAIQAGGSTSPDHDLLVGAAKISLKTETGKGTRMNSINITKLCTTERDPWEAASLVQHVTRHLYRYEHLLMLRAVWQERVIHYQLVDIPIALLRRLKSAKYHAVGKRKGRQSLGADVKDKAGVAFHVHFDGSDGKCQIRNLDRSRCTTLLEWDLQIHE